MYIATFRYNPILVCSFEVDIFLVVIYDMKMDNGKKPNFYNWLCGDKIYLVKLVCHKSHYQSIHSIHEPTEYRKFRRNVVELVIIFATRYLEMKIFYSDLYRLE